MAMRARPARFEPLYTVDEFEFLPEFSDGYELLDGKLVKKTVPGGEHSLIARRIIKAYDRFDPTEKTGFMLQESSVKLGPNNSPTPDVSFWKAERSIKITPKAMPLPDLAVEIHSPGDLQSKTALAGAMIKVQKLVDAGVPIVWVVYPNRQEVAVYHADQNYNNGPVFIFQNNQVLEGESVIPGFKLPVAELFA